ncbi:hypothetical protein H7J86_01605 [Mycobacterium hackensackense]|uniref:hypothetical protein n=1 Tax=Mycobacterium hackensackense TaxID=228909 RepID=UPI002265B4CC|nr:hypothetical protein [Mycobacterium hackensackense]MCV7250851.1 hypothetical protein [Mycobacterium hackensackense]
MNTDTAPMGDIHPGNSIKVDIPFDLPPGTQLSALKARDSMLSGGATVTVSGTA